VPSALVAAWATVAVPMPNASNASTSSFLMTNLLRLGGAGMAPR
jgi:hypothetical protein